LILAQFVRPFVKSQKNDYVDAEAIAEAAQRPTMRFVPIKTEDQLDLQAIHRVRERLVERRTALINQFRAFLLERGIIIRTGRECLLRRMPEVLATAEAQLAPRMFRLLTSVTTEWRAIEAEIAEMDCEIGVIAATDQACVRLQTVPGIGPLIATAVVAAVGNGAAFSRGREFAAWLGLVPRQASTGGKTKLIGISKHGNTYLRWLFIHGGRSASSFPRTACLRSMAHPARIQDTFQRRRCRYGQQTRAHRLGRAKSAGAVSPDGSVIERHWLRPLHSGYAGFRHRSRLSDELAPLGLDQCLKPAEEIHNQAEARLQTHLGFAKQKN
jgi:transposase